MTQYSSDVAFSPSVKAVQERKGSRRSYARMEQSGSWDTELSPDAARFVEAQTTAFLATANAAGQPYIQHRGGPPGFLRVLDPHTIAFVDFAGNRQYITAGNLAENPRAQLFLIDYATRRRLKIWGDARVVEDDPALVAQLMPAAYDAKPEHVIVFSVSAWDVNCPQHIPQKIDAGDVASAIERLNQRIAELEAENRRLKNAGDVEIDSAQRRV